jgi:flagellar M-ring protein FliF
MAPSPASAQQQLTGLVARLSAGQKALLAGVALASVVAIALLVSVVNRPSLGILFSNLAPEDAGTIVEKLRERKIDYELQDGGRSILVPQNSIYDLRLSLAGEGLPHSSVVGYEIFDRTNLGVSDFVQKVNYRRALEGELARTILQLNEVEGARVHLVMPARALFKEDEHPATASVVLKLRSGHRLSEGSVQGIANLVSASVEGMESRNVTIVDSRGALLSSRQDEGTMASLSTSQLEMQQKVEQHLARKAQTLLEGAVGAGNAIVQVAAELDFRQVERTL